MAIQFNTAPWASTRPADPTNAARQVADKLFTKNDRAKLQAIENQFVDLEREFARLCDAAVYDAEIEKLNESGLPTDERHAAIAAVKERHARVPEYRTDLGVQEAALHFQFKPAAQKLLPGILQVVQASISAIENGAHRHAEEFWQVSGGDDFWLLYPLKRLESILEWKIAALEKARREDIWICRHALAQAGLITPATAREIEAAC